MKKRYFPELKPAGLLLLTALVLLSAPDLASGFCFQEAERQSGVPAGLLWAVAKVESGFDSAAVCRNTDGSLDVGVMQINSRWRPVLGEQTWVRLGDPCTNVKVGASIMADCLARHGYTWEGIGCYNAVSIDKRAAYARRVIAVLEEMRAAAGGEAPKSAPSSPDP